MARVELTIPKHAQPGLVKLIQSPEKDLNDLFSLLDALPPALRIRDLASDLAVKTGQAEEGVRELLTAIGGLYLLLERDGLAVDALVEEVCKALAGTGNPDLQLRDEELETFKRRLAGALSHPHTLGVTAKALDVFVQQERFFCTARVLTDIRPVFPLHSEESPAGFVVLHTLKLRYHEANGTDEFFVVMDSDDVDELIATLERAKRKQDTLKGLLQARNMSILEARHD